MAQHVELVDHAPELDEVVGAALYPGGLNQPGRVEGERTMAQHYGRVVAWFTVREATTTGEHPDYAKQAWAGIPLPVREGYHYPDEDMVDILVLDAFNGLADNKVPLEAIQYWADTFSALGDSFFADDLPVASFLATDGVLEPNLLLDW